MTISKFFFGGGGGDFSQPITTAILQLNAKCDWHLTAAGTRLAADGAGI